MNKENVSAINWLRDGRWVWVPTPRHRSRQREILQLHAQHLEVLRSSAINFYLGLLLDEVMQHERDTQQAHIFQEDIRCLRRAFDCLKSYFDQAEIIHDTF